MLHSSEMVFLAPPGALYVIINAILLNLSPCSNLFHNFHDVKYLRPETSLFLVFTKGLATCRKFALPARLVWLCIKIWRLTLSSLFFKGKLIFIDFKKHICPWSRVYCTKYVQELILDWLWAALMKSYGGAGRWEDIKIPYLGHQA